MSKMCRRSLRLATLTFLLVTALLLAPSEPFAGESGIGGRFIMRNHQGKIVTDQDFRGQFMLVYFGYTFCPDICPTGLGTISQALEQLGKAGEQITPIFITVDPKRDTAVRMWDYVKHFHPRLVGLTGSDEMTTRITKAYKVRYEIVPSRDGDPEAYTVDHSAGVYLMAPDGKFLVKMAHGIAPETMAGRIRDFLKD